MVDVGSKTVTRRVARARALVDLPNTIVEHFDKQKKEIQSKVSASRSGTLIFTKLVRKDQYSLRL